jgi:hypothetical protein
MPRFKNNIKFFQKYCKDTKKGAAVLPKVQFESNFKNSTQCVANSHTQ